MFNFTGNYHTTFVGAKCSFDNQASFGKIGLRSITDVLPEMSSHKVFVVTRRFKW